MFIEVAVVDERGRAEALADALLDAGALSASIEDADAGGSDEDALYGEPGAEPPASHWRRSRVVALFDGAADVDTAIDDALAASGPAAQRPLFERRDVPDADWVRVTQAQFAPISVGRLWIVPSWHDTAAVAADGIVLRLDPGMAFGTGDHATTRLCLAWLDAHLVGSETVVDYGCGSGILAIAAKKLGAGVVVGTDIDAQALTASRRNAADNAVDVAFLSSHDFVSEPVDVVVANILSNPLKVLAPLLSSLVVPGGRLVLSGVLERQWREVAATYAPTITLEPWAIESGWVCLAGRKGSVGGAPSSAGG